MKKRFLFSLIAVLSLAGLTYATVNQQTYLPVVFQFQPELTDTPIPTATDPATATLTAAPTLMPSTTPTPTPTGSPTTEPGTVFILDNHTSYTNSSGWLEIFGEVKNNTSDILRFVEINVSLYYDAALVDTDFGYTWLDNLPAGEITCFNILVIDPPPWTTFEFGVIDYWTDGNSPPNITVSNTYKNLTSFGWVEIGGIASNNESVVVEYVTPVITAYNPAGKVIECGFTYVDSTDLDPGQSSTFEAILFGENPADINSYRIQVDGDQ